MFEGQNFQIRYDELCDASNQCAQIAENFAIGFAEWIHNNCDEFPRVDQKQLLEIYNILMLAYQSCPYYHRIITIKYFFNCNYKFITWKSQTLCKTTKQKSFIQKDKAFIKYI